MIHNELVLLRDAKVGCCKSREDLLKLYRPLVLRTARRMIGRANGWLEFDDLVSVGLVGLDKAITQFDETRGTRFPYYAGKLVRFAIQKELNRRQPADCQITDGQLRSIPDKDTTVTGGRTYGEKGDEFVMASRTEQRIIDKQFWKGALRCLSHKERLVVKKIIWDEMSMQEVADDLGLSKSWVCGIYQTALEKLKEHLIENGFDAALPVLE